MPDALKREFALGTGQLWRVTALIQKLKPLYQP